MRGQIISFEILRKKKWKNITKNHLICVKNDKKNPLKVHKFLVAHANLKILRKVRKNLRGRTTAQPHILETLIEA